MNDPDEWIDLGTSTVVDAFNVSSLTIMDAEGVGEAFMLNFRDARNHETFSFVLYPWLAKQLSFHLIGTTLGVREVGSFDADDDE